MGGTGQVKFYPYKKGDGNLVAGVGGQKVLR